MGNKSLDPFPILTTEKLTLRQLSIDDRESIFELRSDKEINKYLGRKPSETIEDAVKFINIIGDNSKNNDSIYWVITLTETNTFVGTICLFDFSNENDSCEIGYELMTKYQGQGIMREAVTKIIDYVFQTLKFKKIVAFTHKGNQQSTKLLENFNFIRSAMEAENPDFTVFILTGSN